MLKVGRCTYDPTGKRIDPKIPTFTNILVLMKSSLYWELSPYYLKDDRGVFMENKWQFSKVYPSVPYSSQKYSRYDKTVIWEHPAETHIEKNELTQKYWDWREKGMMNPHPVRYPVGYNYRRNCVYALKDGSDEKLDYIKARKEIYVPEYCKLVKAQKKFTELKKRLARGENLLIVEVDGPHQDSLPYYIGRYNVTKDFFVNNTVDVTDDNMKILLNDQKHNFGHGYCLGMALLGVDENWIKGNAPTFKKFNDKPLPLLIKTRTVTALSNRKIDKVVTKSKEMADKKEKFNEKMKQMPEHVDTNKLDKNKNTKYSSLTTNREYIVNAEDYNLEEDLDSMIKGDLISKNVSKSTVPKIKSIPKKKKE